MIGAPVLECIFDTARHPKRPVYNPDPATQVGLGGRVSSAVWARDNGGEQSRGDRAIARRKLIG